MLWCRALHELTSSMKGIDPLVTPDHVRPDISNKLLPSNSNALDVQS